MVRSLIPVLPALLLAPVPAAADADGPDFFSVTGVAAGDVLDVRAAPDPQAEQVGKIPPDGTCVRNLGCRGVLTFREYTELPESERARRTAEHPRWCRIEYQGLTGWVAGRYLREGACGR